MIPFSADDATRIAGWLGTPCPTVYNGYIHCRNEHEWLTARARGIGASEVGIIVGVSPWSSTYALWWRKKLDWRLPGTESMRWGHLVEDPIAELFAEHVEGDLYVAKPLGHPYSLWHHPVSTWAMCTPDRLAVRREHHDVVPVEIKSDEGGDGWGEPHTADVPTHYRCQALWQAFVLGAPGTYVVRKRSSGRGRVTWYWVPFDSEACLLLLDRAWAFLTSIDHDNPPPVDGSDATADTLKEINAVAEDTFATVDEAIHAEWVAARQAKRDALKAEKLASNRLRAAMGTANYASYTTADGLDVVFAKRRVGKRDGYTVAPGTVDELRGIGSGQHAPRTPLPGGGDDAAPPPQASEEEPRGSDGAGGGMGDSAGSTEEETGTGEDPGRSPLSRREKIARPGDEPEDEMFGMLWVPDERGE